MQIHSVRIAKVRNRKGQPRVDRHVHLLLLLDDARIIRHVTALVRRGFGGQEMAVRWPHRRRGQSMDEFMRDIADEPHRAHRLI